MKKVLVLGYGNPLRGDDGVGQAVALALHEELGRRGEGVSGPEEARAAASAEGVSIRPKALHQLTPEIAADVAGSDLVIFIDASCDNGPGEVASRRVVPAGAPPHSDFSHQLTPEVLLAFAGRLYGTCPEAILFSVGAATFEYGEGLSAEVQAAVPVLLAQVQAACAARFHSSTSTSRNPE